MRKEFDKKMLKIIIVVFSIGCVISIYMGYYILIR